MKKKNQTDNFKNQTDLYGIMNNISIRRKNNIYKIYSKLNDSYRRYIIERDGQKKVENESKINRIEPNREKTENKPCNIPILAVYRKKIWICFKKIIYKPIPCSISKNEIVNSKIKIENDIQEEIYFQKIMEAERILLEKEIVKYNEREKKRRVEQKIEREKRKEEEKKEIEIKYKQTDKLFKEKTLELKEKLESLQQKKWFGQTSNGSKICFFGVENIDYADLGNEYIELLVYNILKESRIEINWNPNREPIHLTRQYTMEFRKIMSWAHNTRYRNSSEEYRKLKRLIENSVNNNEEKG
jgi:hypothetical protein